MSRTSEHSVIDRVQMVLATVICGAILLFFTYDKGGFKTFYSPSTPAADKHDVRAGVAILERAHAPIRGMQMCDAVKSLLPDMFNWKDAQVSFKQPSDADVILCFREDIDYGEAVKAALQRGLAWEQGIGGDKIVVFATSEQRFRQVAMQSGLVFAPGELRPLKILLNKLVPRSRAQKTDDGWAVRPAVPGQDDEVLFGPYVDLVPGAYAVNLELEPAGHEACGRGSASEHLQMLVTSDARAHVLAPLQPLNMSPEGGSSCRLKASLQFTVTQPVKSVETPISLSGFVPMKLVSYELVGNSSASAHPSSGTAP